MALPPIESSLMQLREQDDVVIIEFTAQSLTESENIEEMGQQMFSLVESFSYRKIIVNLADVDFVSSSFLGKLITLHRKIHREHGKLVVCGQQGSVAEVMHCSKLDAYLNAVRDVESALQAFR